MTLYHYFHTPRISVLCLLLALPAVLFAQSRGSENCCSDSALTASAYADDCGQHKIITNVLAVGIGSTNILDTYLSPEKYSGAALNLFSQTERRRPGSMLSRQITYRAELAYAHNRADNGNDMVGQFRFSYGVHRHFALCGGALEVKAGGLADVTLGFIYNTRNGNNPAQARLHIDLTPSASARYAFNVGSRRCHVGYEVAIPLVGVMFSPNYGQSYYEIFSRGNYDHNIVPTTFVCSPSLRHMLSLDINIGRNALRLGYMGDVRQANVNSLKYHTYNHSLVVGIVRKFSIHRLRQ